MSIENVSFIKLVDVTITITDKDTKEKAGQLRYQIIDSDAEIFDTYLYPEYRWQRIMSNLFKEVASELKTTGIKKIKIQTRDDNARIAWAKMGFTHVDEKGNMEYLLN